MDVCVYVCTVIARIIYVSCSMSQNSNCRESFRSNWLPKWGSNYLLTFVTLHYHSEPHVASVEFAYMVRRFAVRPDSPSLWGLPGQPDDWSNMCRAAYHT
jgi:hypothetical protein